MMKDTGISERKSDHIQINLEQDVQSGITTGLERYSFQHCALPDLNLDEIDIATEHPEFSAWRWADLAEAPTLIVPFKRELYREISAAFAALPKRIATSG